MSTMTQDLDKTKEQLLEELTACRQRIAQLEGQSHTSPPPGINLMQISLPFEKIFHLCPFPVALSSLKDGRYIDVNAGFVRFLKYSREEIIGRTSIELQLFSNSQTRQRYLDGFDQHGFLKGLEIILKDKEGREHVGQMWGIKLDFLAEPLILTLYWDITQETLTEKTLRNCEERFAAIFNNSILGISILDLAGHFLSVNDSICRILGYEKREIIGKHYCHFANPAAMDEDEELYQSLIKGERQSYQVDQRYIRKDGSLAWVRLFIALLFDPTISQQYCIVISEDISDRKRIEAELVESETRYRLLFEKSPAFHFVIGLEGTILDVNEHALNNFGYSKEEVVGQSAFHFIVPSQRDRVADLLRKYTNEEIPNPYAEVKIIAKDKTVKSIFLSPKEIPIFEKTERKAALISGIDISYRVGMEESLKESEERFRSIFNNAGVGIAIVDQAGYILSANEAYCHFLGYPPEEIVGMHFTQITHPEDIDGDQQLFQNLLKGEATNYQIDNRYIRKNGDTVWGRLTVSIICEHPVHPKNAVVICEDITDRKKAEKNLKCLVEDLHASRKMIEERAGKIELLNRELQESEALLKASNADKDKFFSIIAHDLKSPFSGLIGLSAILTDEIESLSKDEIQTFSKTLHDTAQNLFKLLENLLEWSLIQRGIIEYCPEPIPVKKLISENIALFSEMAGKKFIELKNGVEQELYIQADGNMVNSIVRNLLGNAIKFTNYHGEIQILSRECAPGWVEISVRDNGVGIEKNIRDQLFRIDQNITSPGTANERGTGLGLILCKELVEKHGGKIWLESRIDQGTTFYFTLPKKPD